MSIDATKVARAIELCTAYKVVVGKVHLNHFISIEGLTPEQIEDLLVAKTMADADEMKIAVVLFQQVP
eukprot:2411131-Ditylum_brightwellii.AAC.1